MQFITNLNGSEVEFNERKDNEIYYIKKAYEDFIINVKPEKNVDSLEDETL